MKSIRILALFLFAATAGVFVISCGSAEDKLVGTWVTESVTANVDSTKVNLQSIDQTLASTKTTRFILNEDHTMALSIDGYTTDAYWTYNSGSDMVSFRLEAEVLENAIELGKFTGGKIVYTSSVKNGTITAVYIKE